MTFQFTRDSLQQAPWALLSSPAKIKITKPCDTSGLAHYIRPSLVPSVLQKLKLQALRHFGIGSLHSPFPSAFSPAKQKSMCWRTSLIFLFHPLPQSFALRLSEIKKSALPCGFLF
jgi:hypothetical protein